MSLEGNLQTTGRRAPESYSTPKTGCPKDVTLTHWGNEFKRFSPELSPQCRSELRLPNDVLCRRYFGGGGGAGGLTNFASSTGTFGLISVSVYSSRPLTQPKLRRKGIITPATGR